MPAIREHFHFIGICGRAMSAIAIALARAGHVVTGSDQDTYGAARDCLRRAGIPVSPRFDAANLRAGATIVIGRRVTSSNPEWAAARELGLRCLSFPMLLRERFLSRSRNAVVAGGVGKTTTTAMLAWIVEHAGLRPDFLIGGSAGNFELSARFDGAPVTVIEGDEYAASDDDPTPKFMYYAPHVAVVTNLLEDHPDLYPDAQSVESAFRNFVQLLPADGTLVISADDLQAVRLSEAAGCRTLRVGPGSGSDVRLEIRDLDETGSVFHLSGVEFQVPMYGAMNIRNAAMAAAAAAALRIGLEQSAEALSRFAGVDDRQHLRLAGGRTLVTDKASHPESFRELAPALRQRFPGRRVIAVVEPRATGGRHWIYQRDLPAALAAFDCVVLAAPYEHRPPQRTRWSGDPFSIDQLANEISDRGTPVVIAGALANLPGVVASAADPGDVVLLALREQHAAHVEAVRDALCESDAALRRSRAQ